MRQNRSSTQFLNSVYFLDLKTGFAVGGGLWQKNGIILKTTDGGTTWDKLSYEKSNELYYEFKSVFFINSSTGYAIGSSISMSPYKKAVSIDKVDGLILKTNDGGNTWIKQESNVSNVLLSIFFVNNVGYITGDKGLILKTINEGNLKQ